MDERRRQLTLFIYLFLKNIVFSITHAFVISSLDYCNSVFATSHHTHQFRKIMNLLLYYCGKFICITTLLCKRHCLPIKFCSHFEIFLITYKIFLNLTLLTSRHPLLYSNKPTSFVLPPPLIHFSLTLSHLAWVLELFLSFPQTIK